MKSVIWDESSTLFVIGYSIYNPVVPDWSEIYSSSIFIVRPFFLIEQIRDFF